MHARSIQTKAQTESKAAKKNIEVPVSLPPPPLHTCPSKEDTLKAPFAGATAVFFAAAGKLVGESYNYAQLKPSSNHTITHS